MKLHVDKEADALYLRLDDSTIVEAEEVSPGVVLDYNASNEVVGVELLYLSKRSSNLKFSTLEFETAWQFFTRTIVFIVDIFSRAPWSPWARYGNRIDKAGI